MAQSTEWSWRAEALDILLVVLVSVASEATLREYGPIPGECVAIASATDVQRTIALNRASLLAGSLKSQNLTPHWLRKLDERELVSRKEVVFSALIDDSNQIVLGGLGVRDNAIDLAQDE